MSSASGSDTWATVVTSQGAGAAATYENATLELSASGFEDTTVTATITASAATRATARTPRPNAGTRRGKRTGRNGRSGTGSAGAALGAASFTGTGQWRCSNEG